MSRAEPTIDLASEAVSAGHKIAAAHEPVVWIANTDPLMVTHTQACRDATSLRFSGCFQIDLHLYGTLSSATGMPKQRAIASESGFQGMVQSL